METFVETNVMSLESFYSGRVGAELLAGKTLPLESFDFNNVPSSTIRLRSYYLKNETPVYTGWIYNGKKISLDELREILEKTKKLRDDCSSEIYVKKMQYPTDVTPVDSRIAFLSTTFGKLGYLIDHIKDTIKYMETYNLKYACGVNFTSFYPMFEDDLVLTEYLEMMKEKKIADQAKANEQEMKATIIELITTFKSQNRHYFGQLGDGNWDFSWLDTATKEDTYNLFMLCVKLIIGLNEVLSAQEEQYLEMLGLLGLLDYISPKKPYEEKRLG
jgi:hypothetical protein